MHNHWQYQAKVEPLEPTLHVVPAMDSWFAQASEPVRVAPELLREGYSVGPLEPTLYVIPEMSTWFMPASEPVLPLPPVDPGWFDLPFEEIITPVAVPDFAWYAPASEPTLPLEPLTPEGYSVGPLEPTLYVIPEMSTWFMPASEPVLPLPPVDPGWFDLPFEEVLPAVPDFAWFVPASEPIFDVPRIDYFTSGFDLEEITPPTTPTFPAPWRTEVPTRTQVSAVTFTFSDAIERLVEYAGGGSVASDQVRMRQAVLDAYAHVTRERKWEYLLNEHRIHLSAPYSTGTIVYDHTGGTNELEVTLSSGTWPSWAADGSIVISGVTSRVQTRESDTVLTLDSIINPGADVAALTTYTLHRSTYSLPENFRTMYGVLDENTYWRGHYVTPMRWKAMERASPGQSDTWAWTLMGHPDIYNEWVIRLFGHPTKVETMDFIMLRFARSLWYSGYDTGSGTPSKGGDRQGTITSVTGAAVVGSGTDFRAEMAGSVFRYRDTSKQPTSRSGLYPWIEQRIVKSGTVASDGLSLTLDSALTNDVTDAATKYIITDPIDIHRDLLQAFIARCKYEYDEASNADEKQVAKSLALYERKRNFAMESIEAVKDPTERTGLYYTYGNPWWLANVDFDL